MALITYFLLIVLAFNSISCDGKWDTSRDRGFIVPTAIVSEPEINCGENKPGSIATYEVECLLEGNIVHPAMFKVIDRVLIVPKWRPLEEITEVEAHRLLEVGMRPRGVYVPETLGIEYSAVIESDILPLFHLVLGSESTEQRESPLEAKFTLTVSATKCELLNAGNESFRYCFDFGGK